MKMCILQSFRGIALFGLLVSIIFPNLSLAEVSAETNATFTSVPINLTGNDVAPLVMLDVSRDHQLSYKAYNDFSDLDGDGVPEKTYEDTIDYYGYFDSAKCYTYNSTDNRFVPAGMASGTNKHYCSNQWSGNFLNWGTMTRMDVVRKMLYGGKRFIDNLAVSPTSTSTTSRTIPTSANKSRTFTTNLTADIGDLVKASYDATHWMIGNVTVKQTGPQRITIKMPLGNYINGGSTSYNNWTLENLTQTSTTTQLTVLERQYLPTDAHAFAKYYNGPDIAQLTPFSETEITIANLTLGSTTGVNRYSDTNTNPPMIRVARGNFALWAANERWQCYWSDETGGHDNQTTTSNGNIPAESGLDAKTTNPSQATDGLGTGFAKGEYLARVEVCSSGFLGQEKCKKYGDGYKPVGLLQIYGDDDQISFGLMTSTFEKNISGGVLRKNIGAFKNEINNTDGTFISDFHGIVDNLNKIRIYGYDYNDGTYIGHDNCTFQQTGLVLSGGATTGGQPANQGNCSSWGNPMSEVYLESLRYLAGQSANTDFTYGSGSKDEVLGLTLATWADPLGPTNYCAPLNILNFNASVSSYDGDQVSGISQLGSSSIASALTDTVGIDEEINTSKWFIGDNGATTDEVCSSKDIGSGFGSYSGLCPEAPTQKGTYLMSGIAYYANTHRIRSDLTIPTARSNSRDLMVSTYGIALATNVPKIEISTNAGKVTILPAYRLKVSSAYGGGTLVDFKIIEQTPTYGKFYVNWEDSEMGGDYDQDVWGTIKYSVNNVTNTITITTDVIAESTDNPQGFGYIISGTDKDGAHFYSGIEGFNYKYKDSSGVETVECNNCQKNNPAVSAQYTINGSSAGVLKDPLWYAAKYGGFIEDRNTSNGKPDQVSEWDAKNNSDGTPGSDGLPDNYFYATNPLQLENSLNRVFLNILQRASSGTAAAVVSNNVSGVGALYQAYYEPSRQDVDNKEVSWIGTVQALWLDDYGFLREDNGNATLDGYFTDRVIEQYYDETQNKTRIRRYVSTKDDKFTPYYMQGKVTAFDAGTGAVKFTVAEISNDGSSNSYNNWTVYNLTTGKTGSSATSSPIIGVTEPITITTFTVSPATSWFSVGDTIMVAHFESDEEDFENVGTIWNAREQLSFDDVDGTYATTQRVFSFPADGDSNGGRFIKTWFDDGGGTTANANNGVVDANEFVDFTNSSITSSNYGYLNVATEADAKNLVDYIRGKEISGYRNRTIKYDGTNAKVMRLADVVNATPTIVGAPQEALDLLYKDASYGVFRKQYAKRRQVLYVGSNGGMLHAFNGGFYDSASKSFVTNGVDYHGNNVTEHPLGAEIWAYVPMNLLPHLKWLKDPDYTHVYYVDGKPKVFDAKIFDGTETDHPGGWGTILVVGMRLGGGAMTVDTAADGLTADTTPADNRVLSSAYIIMDITNPEVGPKLLAEIQLPDSSFSTSYPAAFTVKDKDPTSTTNKWFLTFGSGPTALGGESTQNAKLYVFDLNEIASPGSTTTHPAGCQIVNAGASMKMFSCDTGIANSFVGDPISVDWELDYKADSIYFGVVGDKNSNSGQVMRLEY